MEHATRERKIIRRRFTLCAQKLQEFIDKNEVLHGSAEAQKLAKIHEDLLAIQNKCLGFLIESESIDEALVEEQIQQADSYDTTFYLLQEKINRLQNELDRESSKSSVNSIKKGGERHENVCDHEKCSNNKMHRRFSLPRLDLPKFNGEIKHWLGFWSQFKKIDADETIDAEDKFGFLLQCMVEGSPSRDLVNSFPPTAANYPKVIEQLKNRFGRENILIEHYVRELLQLVIARTKSSYNVATRELYDKMMTQILALESMGITHEKYAAFLYPLVESALPEDILRVWNRMRSTTNKGETAPLSKLLEFIRAEVESEERIQLSRTGLSGVETTSPSAPTASFLTESVKKQTKSSYSSSASKDQKPLTCIWCTKPHPSSECHNAQKMTLDERKEHLKEKKACFRCLKIGHGAARCRKFVRCVACSRSHYTLLCPDLKPSTSDQKENDDSTPTVMKQAVNTSVTNTVLLPTVKLNIVNEGKHVTVRALLDSGAQRSFVKSDVIEKLKLQPDNYEKIRHNLFGGVVTKLETHRAFVLCCQSLDGSQKFNLDALESKVICDNLPKVGSGELVSKLHEKGITLSDCANDVSEISLLIGSNVLGSLYTGRSAHVSENLAAVETKLGWTIQGPTVGMYTCSINVCTAQGLFDVDDLWNLETLGIRDEATVKNNQRREQEVESYFRETIQVDDEGRYEVRLPWKETGDVLSPNFDVAYKRLKSTTSKLTKLELLPDYNKVFDEWLESDIIEVAANDNKESGHYLPHHAVVREQSLTTRIRPVFDASAVSKESVSLNSCLEKGSNLIACVPRLLIDFRKGAIGITSDIKKAFLQIGIHPEDRDYLKFLWWQDVNATEKVLKVFRHRRVVFGVTTSPYLLSATISFHLEKFEGETAERLRKCFYVDNCVVSVDTEEEMKKFIDEAKEVMNKGKFELRCWVTGPVITDNEIKNTSVLGLTWDPQKDELWCKAPAVKKDEKLSKRKLLSMAQSIFDPIGFLSPTTIVPKILIQKSWKMNMNWDDDLSEDIAGQARDWLRHLDAVNECRIPRRMSHTFFNQSDVSLHVFCDACQTSYAGCVYVRTEHLGEVSVQLVLAKSRVAPIKSVTIPRLELIAALMATRLASEVKEVLHLGCKEYYWTDSSIVIAWLKRISGLNVFVYNRVKEILTRTNVEDWRHVPGEMNPADLPSRGVNAQQLLDSRWWEGPSWLKDSSTCWPHSNVVPNEEEVLKEIKKSCLTVQVGTDDKFSERLTYFSKYSKIVRTVGWCIRFIDNCHKKRSERSLGFLDAVEFIQAEKKLCLVIQQESLDHIDDLKKKLNLELLQDEDGLIRVKTRLTMGDDSENFIKPVLLPSLNVIVQRLVLQEHLRLHVGTQTLISILRENWWIIGIRGLVKKIVRECIRCRRYKAQACTVPSAPLPADRIQCGNPFDVIGTDLAGPICLKGGSKRWIVLFTCATYRALHLEVVESLSTEDYLMCLRRFVARRGRIKVIYSDNGTNFRGASNLLNNLDWVKIKEQTSVDKIQWRFLPPQAPWWGGWYERMVRTIKDLLRRTLGRAALVDKEFVTILCEVESAINSRPLTYICDGSENFKALTPFMFLHANIPDATDLENVDGQILTSRYRYMTKLSDDIKQRFHSEYLSLLTQKFVQSTLGVSVGDIVLVGVDGLKRVYWPLGLVTEVIPGADGVSRVAKVKLGRGILVRPFQRLYRLELSADESKFLVPQTSMSDRPAVVPDDSKSIQPLTSRAGRPLRAPERLKF